MATVRLFCADLAGGTLTLSSEESHHAVVARRLYAGDAVVLFDGAGGEAEAVVTKADRRGVVVEARDLQRRPYDADLRLTLAVAMGKAHRQAYIIEKCTELGVAAIWPMLAERSVTKPGPSVVEKWSRRAIEAAKQSRRCWVPVIHAPQTLTQVVTEAARFSWVGFADTGGTCAALDGLLRPLASGADVLVLVGPEGGFGDAERDIMRDAGAVGVSVATTVLRTETAAVAVCAAVAMRSVRTASR